MRAQIGAYRFAHPGHLHRGVGLALSANFREVVSPDDGFGVVEDRFNVGGVCVDAYMDGVVGVESADGVVDELDDEVVDAILDAMTD